MMTIWLTMFFTFNSNDTQTAQLFKQRPSFTPSDKLHLSVIHLHQVVSGVRLSILITEKSYSTWKYYYRVIPQKDISCAESAI
jgi:hypothetical protein